MRGEHPELWSDASSRQAGLEATKLCNGKGPERNKLGILMLYAFNSIVRCEAHIIMQPIRPPTLGVGAQTLAPPFRVAKNA